MRRALLSHAAASSVRPSLKRPPLFPPIGLDPALLSPQIFLKRGGNMRFKDGRMRISSSVLPIQFRVVSRLSVLHPGEASSGRVPPSLPVAFCSPSLSTQGRLSGQRRERKKESLLRRSLHCPLYNTIRGTDAGLKSTIQGV